MKRIFFTLLTVVLCCISCSRPSRTEGILRELDGVLAERQQYISQKESEIAHKRELYEVASGTRQFDLCKDIYELYNGFNTDSALFYSLQCQQLAERLGDHGRQQQALIFTAHCLSINCLYERALSIMEPLEATIEGPNRSLYYKAFTSLRFWEGQFTTLPGVQEANWDKISDLRRKTIASEPSYVWRRQEEAILLSETDPHGALDLLCPVLDSLPADDDKVRYLSNSVGSFYARLAMPDSALYYYAKSAISDMQHGIMEHASLREVALILYKQGDISRAYRYMSVCIEDAQLCKARLRTIEMANDMPVIMEAYQRTIHRQRVKLSLGIGILIIGLLVVAAMLVYAYRSRQKTIAAREEALRASELLRSANEQLQHSLCQLEESNQSLRDSNRIRAAYVTQYMKECSDTIEKLDLYHKQLLRVAHQDSPKKLFEAVRSTEFIEENLRDFYLHFDATFLSLFPHFVASLNALLRPDEQYALPQNDHLSTELRIFALIRLGITDSDDIARFLRLSTKTVYNYRASVRNRAIAAREQLEEQVAKIGL